MKWPVSAWMMCLAAALVVTGCDGRLALDEPAQNSQGPSQGTDPDRPGEPTDPDDSNPACTPLDRHFRDEVWTKVAEPSCVNCHVEGGLAGATGLVLTRSTAPEDLRRNLEAFEALALQTVPHLDDLSLLLAKASGTVAHGGGAVAQPGSTRHRILEHFVSRVDGSSDCPREGDGSQLEERPFFEGIEMLSDRRLLRRAALSLVGRLPTADELARVDRDGLAAFDPILDAMMKEDAFYLRLKEGFNDIFMTDGYEGVGQAVLSYAHFRSTLWWYEDLDLSHLPEDERLPALWRIGAFFSDAIRWEPKELVAHIVRNDLPFTQILTADYIMVSPYSARGYGIFSDVEAQFVDVDNPFEYVPGRLPALKDGDVQVQESSNGLYPHAGLITQFQYLRRFPTTETNRNRHRVLMFYRHFLGVDLMDLAPTETDAAEATERYDNPVMQAADCVVCHKIIDPVAGLFQDYYNDEGHYGPRREGWFTDVFAPGFEGEPLPESERWRALQWLAERAVQDRRFATAMVEHAYYVLTERRPLRAPKDIDDPFFAQRRRAYEIQQETFSAAADRFVASNYNLKEAFKALVPTPLYRADGLESAIDDPARRAEIDALGLANLISPEQLGRKTRAIFGESWEGVSGDYHVLYGGNNVSTILERLKDPSGAMGAIQRRMANDIPCAQVSADFGRPPSERKFFPLVERDVLPDTEPQAERRIREQIVYLHDLLLGLEHGVDHPEVDRTFALLRDVVREGQEGVAAGRHPLWEMYACRADGVDPVDEAYILRGWRAVLTYLLRQYHFLYE
jgi:hypothetical protein